jgi:glycosyltransferase involved in cell wall biosynthesis
MTTLKKSICFTSAAVIDDIHEYFHIGDRLARLENSLNLFEKVIFVAYTQKSHKTLSYKRKDSTIYLFYLPKFFASKRLKYTLFPLRLIYSSMLLMYISIKHGTCLIQAEDWLCTFFALPCKLINRKILMFLQGEFEDNSVTSFAQSFIFRSVDVIVCVNRKLARKIIERGARTVLVIPNGVDITRFRPLRLSQRRTFGLNNKFVVLYAGRLSYEKGVDFLPATLSIAKNAISTIHLLIAGEGPLRGHLEKEFSEKGLSPFVSFLGAIPHEQMPIIINSADVLLLPSLTEGLPLIVQEALACEKLVIASNVGGLDEIVDHGKNGFLVKPGDVKQMVDFLIMIFKNFELRERLGVNGRKTVESRFSRARTFEMFLSAYRDLYRNI